MPDAVGTDPEGHCSFCGGPPSDSGKAKLFLCSKDRLVAVCGKCIESHAELLRHVEERRRDSGGA
jgi:hypothetical protein